MYTETTVYVIEKDTEFFIPKDTKVLLLSDDNQTDYYGREGLMFNKGEILYVSRRVDKKEDTVSGEPNAYYFKRSKKDTKEFFLDEDTKIRVYLSKVMWKKT